MSRCDTSNIVACVCTACTWLYTFYRLSLCTLIRLDDLIWQYTFEAQVARPSVSLYQPRARFLPGLQWLPVYQADVWASIYPVRFASETGGLLSKFQHRLHHFVTVLDVDSLTQRSVCSSTASLSTISSRHPFAICTNHTQVVSRQHNYTVRLPITTSIGISPSGKFGARTRDILALCVVNII
jgi:hypothetical protein